MNIHKLLAALIASALCLSMVTTSNAALVSRLDGLAVYDTDLDITWLADANAAVDSGFDNGFGRMTWLNANAWADSLTIGGFMDWRLPTTLQPDASCSEQGVSGSVGTGCIGGEMGHLNNVELVSLATPGLFSNIQFLNYWTATENANNSSQAWRYNLFGGTQDINNKDVLLFALPVRSGDVSAIPVPAAIWFFGTALIGLFGFSKRSKAAWLFNKNFNIGIRHIAGYSYIPTSAVGTMKKLARVPMPHNKRMRSDTMPATRALCR